MAGVRQGYPLISLINWLLIGAHFIYTVVIWWFIFLPAVGQTGNTGSTDPTSIKWYILVNAIVSFLLLIISVAFGAYLVKDRFRQQAGSWHFVEASYFMIVMAIFAWIADGTNNEVFVDGSPVIPPSADADFVAKMYTFIFWEAILIISLVFHSLIITSTLHGWRMIINARTSKDITSRVKNKRGSKEDSALNLFPN